MGDSFPSAVCITHNPMLIDGKILFHFGDRLLGMKQDRISYVGARSNAEFSTVSFTMPESDLLLNAAVPSPDRHFASAQAYVMVGIVDDKGNIMPGWELQKCVIRSHDDIALPLRWNGKSAGEFAGRRIRLRFLLRSSNVYAVTSHTAGS